MSPKKSALTKLEYFAASALQGIMANPALEAAFWKDYDAIAKESGAAAAAETIERRIGRCFL